MANHVIPADFFGISISVIDHAGKKWITAEAAGRCLGYSEANLRHGILKLYRHHTDEFTEADKGVIKLATPGGTQSAVIFSDTGCIKLGFFANTPRAKAFRAWAARTLAGCAVEGEALASLAATLGRELLRADPRRRRILHYRRAGLSVPEIARLTGRGRSAIQNELRRMETCGLIEIPPEQEARRRIWRANLPVPHRPQGRAQ